MKCINGTEIPALKYDTLAVVQEYLLNLHEGVRHIELRRETHEVHRVAENIAVEYFC